MIVKDLEFLSRRKFYIFINQKQPKTNDMRQVKLALLFIVLMQTVKAQTEMSVFNATGRAGVATTFATDYQSIGINPANLGWRPKYTGKTTTFTLLEGAYSLYSEALNKPELKESIKNFNSNDFTYQEKLDAAQSFTNNGVAANIDLTAFAIAVQLPKIGGFAFAWRERVSWYSKFNKTASEIMFLGYNAPYFDQKFDEFNNMVQDSSNFYDLATSGQASSPKLFSEILNGSKMRATWFREYNLSYGFTIKETEKLQWFGGLGLKYLQGLAIIDVFAEDGKFEAFSAITPKFDIDYGVAASQNPSTKTQSGGMPNSVGSGFGFDIGTSFIINQKWKFGLAVNDIGSINWNGNVYTASDDTLFNLNSDGFDSYNIFAESQEVVGDNGVFTWQGERNLKVKLPTKLRFGASFKPSDKFELGYDMVIPLNKVSGSYEKPAFGLGVDFGPAKWLILSTGLAIGGNYDMNIPIGLAVALPSGTWEFGVASRDMITFFSQNNPTLSLSFGFLRFRI